MDVKVFATNRNRLKICVMVGDYIVSDLRRFNIDQAMRAYRDLLARIGEFLEGCRAVSADFEELGFSVADMLNDIMGQLQEIMKAQVNQDTVLLADLLQYGLRPILIQYLGWMQEIAEAVHSSQYETNMFALRKAQPELSEMLDRYHGSALEQEERSHFHLELTESGQYTIRYEYGDMNCYLYGNGSPMVENYNYIREILDANKAEYHILGSGLSYQAFSVLRASRYSAVIHLYDASLASLTILLEYTEVAKWIERGQLILHYDPLLQELSMNNKNPLFQTILYPPAIRMIPDERVRLSYEKFAITEQSMREQSILLYSNYYRNMSDACPNVDELAEDFLGKKVYIIAAGPSLDKNLKELEQRETDSLIIATGTVLRKLLHQGIRPDYVILSEANNRVIKQIREVEDCQVPMIILPTVASQIRKNYHAPIYIALQKEFAPAEAYATEHGNRLYMTGGSVSTLALDVAIQLGARAVVFLGLDLAFTGMVAHASDTSQMQAPNAEDLTEIPASDGGTVYADAKFILYRDWFKRRMKMKDAKAIRVVDATEGGALIPGMEIMPLSEALMI